MRCIRKEKLTIGIREYEVSDYGSIIRLPYQFITPTGGIATKKTLLLKPSKTKNGYMRLCLSDGNYFVHRIIWMAFNGEIPDNMDVDHLNGIRIDNRLKNLRLATRQENALNRQTANKNSKSGVRGVSFHKSNGCWIFEVSGKTIASSRDKQKVVDTAMAHHGKY